MKKQIAPFVVAATILVLSGCSGINQVSSNNMNCNIARVLIGALVIFFFVLAKMTNILRDEIGNCAIYENKVEKTALRKNQEIKDLKRPYSLSRAQLAVWTTIIGSTYIYQVLCNNCVGQINTTALVLMGISTGTTAIGKLIDNNDIEEDKLRHQDQPSKGFFIDILSDENGISIHRFQNFIWTIIAIIIYVYKLNNSVLASCLPDLDTTLLALTGISSATYLALKGKENNVDISTENTSNNAGNAKEDTAQTGFVNVPESILIEAIEANASLWKEKFNVIDISIGKKKTNGIQTNINCIVFKPTVKLDTGAFLPIPQTFTYKASNGTTYEIPTDVQETKGLIKPSFFVNAMEGCDRMQLKRPGCSVSRLASDATGTIGLKVYKEGKSFILSCYHVLCAPELDNGIFAFDPLNPQGDTTVISPSKQDGGKDENLLAKVTEGKLTGFLDCAIAELSDDLAVKREICRIDQEPSRITHINLDHVEARFKVFMSGRTSRYQIGHVKSSYASTDITYEIGGRSQVKTLSGLICTSAISQGGDSGAPVVDEDCNIIGLVVASSPTDSYIIPISRILVQLNLSLNT